MVIDRHLKTAKQILQRNTSIKTHSHMQHAMEIKVIATDKMLFTPVTESTIECEYQCPMQLPYDELSDHKIAGIMRKLPDQFSESTSGLKYPGPVQCTKLTFVPHFKKSSSKQFV